MDNIAQPNPNWVGESPDAASSFAPYKLYNIGCNQPVELLHFIETLEDALGRVCEKNMLPMQAGDVEATYADIEELVKDTGYAPTTSVEQGVRTFVDWYQDFYGCN